MKITKLLVIAAFIAATLLGRPFPALAEPGHWVERDCVVSYTGASWLFVHTDINACLTDANGGFTTHASHLHIENHGSMPVYYNSTGAHAFNQVVNPGGISMDLLPIYQNAANPLQETTIPFKFWVGDLPDALAPASDFHTALGEDLIGKQLTQTNRIQADASYRRAIALAPSVPGFHEDLGHNLFALGRFADAVDAFREAVRLDPENQQFQSYVLVSYGQLLLAQRKYLQALGYFHMALNLYPNNPAYISYIKQASDAQLQLQTHPQQAQQPPQPAPQQPQQANPALDKQLYDAVVAKNAGLVTDLLNRGANPNAYTGTETPLMAAASNADEDADDRPNADPSIISIIKALLAHGANVNATDKDTKATPLYFACISYASRYFPSRMEAVRLLLAAGAEVNAANVQGLTPLHVLQDSDKDARQLLIAAGGHR